MVRGKQAQFLAVPCQMQPACVGFAAGERPRKWLSGKAGRKTPWGREAARIRIRRHFLGATLAASQRIKDSGKRDCRRLRGLRRSRVAGPSRFLGSPAAKWVNPGSSEYVNSEHTRPGEPMADPFTGTS